jgi:hypothetical protein
MGRDGMGRDDEMQQTSHDLDPGGLLLVSRSGWTYNGQD